MKYVLLIYDGEKGWAKLSEAERQHYVGEFGKLRQRDNGAGPRQVNAVGGDVSYKEKTSCQAPRNWQSTERFSG